MNNVDNLSHAVNTVCPLPVKQMSIGNHGNIHDLHVKIAFAFGERGCSAFALKLRCIDKQ